MGNPLIADDRERLVIPKLQQMGVPLKVQRLEVGDYQFYDKAGGLCLVTRKASDLFDSLSSGHIQNEFESCVSLIQSYGSGMLFFLLEGVWAPTDAGVSYFKQTGESFDTQRLPGGQARGSRYPGRTVVALQVAAASAGIQVLWTPNTDMTAACLGTLYNRGLEGWPTSITKGSRRPDLKYTSADRDRVSRLMAVWPRLSESVAQRLLKEFGTVGAVLSASRERLSVVSGVGKKGLDNLEEVLHGK